MTTLISGIISEPSEPLTRQELERQIPRIEKELFDLKAQLAAIPRQSRGGNLKIQSASPYRCETCGNTHCMNHADPKEVHPGNKWPLLNIRGHTALCGCLEWLP